jgi:predicted MPP superfamily phosphohydrolase
MGLAVLEYFVLAAAFLLQWRAGRDWLNERPGDRVRWAAILASSVILAIATALNSKFLFGLLPLWSAAWLKAVTLAWAFCLLAICITFELSSRIRPFDPSRRKLLVATRSALCVVPVAATGFGVLIRKQFGVREVDVPIPGLPADLNGLRFVQLSDIHLSPFLSEDELAYVVDMANETKAHLAFVTGDLITTRRDPLDACIQQLKRLKSDAGVLSCLGNHERFADAENYTTQQCRRVGIDVLRKEARPLRFGNAVLNVAGVDYQATHDPYLEGTESLVLRRPNHVNVLLSHNPDVFPVAAKQGFDLTIAGHTHGGQVSVEILSRHLNVAQFFTPYTYGLYREGNSAIYVTRGIGTVGIPVRIGAPPEVALIRLCAS